MLTCSFYATYRHLTQTILNLLQILPHHLTSLYIALHCSNLLQIATMAANDRIDPSYQDLEGDISDSELAKAAKLVSKGSKPIKYAETNNPCVKCAKGYDQYGELGFTPCKMPDPDHPKAKNRAVGGETYYKCESCTGATNCLEVGPFWHKLAQTDRNSSAVAMSSLRTSSMRSCWRCEPHASAKQRTLPKFRGKRRTRFLVTPLRSFEDAFRSMYANLAQIGVN